MGKTCYGGGEPAMGKNPQIPSHKHVTETKHCKEIFLYCTIVKLLLPKEGIRCTEFTWKRLGFFYYYF